MDQKNEKINSNITLLELQNQIKEGIEKSVPELYWITAEVGEISNNTIGHCYLELIDYEKGKQIVAAKARAVIWSNTFRTLKPFFETSTGISLCKGLKLLLKVKASFSCVYGLSLVIYDIEPSYTVGELELKRQKTIDQLRREGCLEMNHLIPIPALPRRLAIISAPTAAGYRDFIKHLNGGECNFNFKTTLFEAKMQGDEAPDSIIEALNKISQMENEFDVVVIIRGGGSAMDLICFDDYNLAFNVAQFPLPVITGIGHDHDFHVIDMVANTWVKTPTAVADFLIDIFLQQEQLIMQLYQRISLTLTLKVNNEKQRLISLLDSLKNVAANAIIKRKQELDILQLKLEAADPSQILAKGFALALVNDQRASLLDIKQGKVLKLVLKDGSVEFEIGKLLKLYEK